jgi:general transcriptional corepressor CYC8
MPNILHDGPPPAGPAKEYPPHPPPGPPSAGLEHGPAPPTLHPAPPVTNEPERAARKMDIEEDYDDSGEEDKKPGRTASGPGSAKSDRKNGTPNSLLGPKKEVN